MKTVLYNINTNKVISKIYPNRYNLPIKESHIIELEYIDTPKPEYSNTQKISSYFEHQDGKWVKVWTIANKTAYELYIEDWKYINLPKRFIAPSSLLIEYPGIETWFRYQGLPIEKRGINMYLYLNEVEEEHLELYQMLKSLIIEEDFNPPSQEL